MVGYALSAASDGSYEDILIIIIDAEDFAFAGDGDKPAVYRYSRSLRIARRVDADCKNEEIPYVIIYEIAKYIRYEERKWSFPVALVWSFPEFGKLEILSTEFQEMWPAVMFLMRGINAPYINITDILFENEPRPLYASFFSDVLNELAFSLGIYVDDGFCPCLNSVFCDIRIAYAVKSMFKKDYISAVIDKRIIPASEVRNAGEIKVSRRRAVKMIESIVCADMSKMKSVDIRSELLNLKRQCINKCLSEVLNCLKGKLTCEVMYNNIKNHINTALSGISDMSDELLRKYIISKRTDIYYMTFNDLLSCLTFSDERMDLKSVIGIVRRKNAITRKNRTPKVILTSGRCLF